MESVEKLVRRGMISGITPEHPPSRNFNRALGKGVLKIMSKMGISTVASYHGAQIFEAVGLSRSLSWRPSSPARISRVGKGITLDVIAAGERGAVTPMRIRVDGRRALPTATCWSAANTSGAERGSRHLFNPETVFKLQHSTATGRFEDFRRYTKASMSSHGS